MPPTKPHPEDDPAVPNLLLNAISRRVDGIVIRRVMKTVQEYDQKIQAQMMVGSWMNMLSSSSLPRMFEHAEDNLSFEPSDACQRLGSAFDEKQRRRLKIARNALSTVQAELEKEAPSQQMVRQAMNCATTELRDLHDDIDRAVQEACEQAKGEYRRGAKLEPIRHDSPMRAVEALHGLLVALEAQGPEVSAVLARESARVK